MSTQDNPGIPFQIHHAQQSFRFLELPPALLESITSTNPPRLSLKAALPDPESNSGPANAVLCTDNQTFAVRQVNSSNSVLIVQPFEDKSPTDPDSVPTTCLSAIAQCTTTLELVPSSHSATSLLRGALASYTGSKPDPTLAVKGTERKGKDAILDDLPLSNGEFETAWRAVCAFEFDGQAYEPTAPVLVEIWKSLVSAATLRGMNLEAGFSIAPLAGTVEEDGHLRALLEAVICRLSQDNNVNMNNASLNRNECVPWIGTSLLESLPMRKSETSQHQFLQEWRDQVPESWRGDVSMALLKGKYSLTANGNIKSIEGAKGFPDPNTSAGSNGKASRKWHEKFKAARR